MPNILIIEDEPQSQKVLLINLEKEGHMVTTASSSEQGIEFAKRERPDLIILELTQPRIKGFDVCKILRAQNDTSVIPIIILSDSDDVTDKIIGLELGADDYISKPYSLRELSARIKARLREAHSINTRQSPLTWGKLKIAKETYTVTIADQPISLTVKEFELLIIFVTNPQQVFSREYLVQKVWGNFSSSGTRALDVHISHLRNKLKALGPVLDSVRGVGYTLTHRQ